MMSQTLCELGFWCNLDAQSPEHFDSVGAAALTSVMPIVHLLVATLIGAALTYGVSTYNSRALSVKGVSVAFK